MVEGENKMRQTLIDKLDAHGVWGHGLLKLSDEMLQGMLRELEAKKLESLKVKDD